MKNFFNENSTLNNEGAILSLACDRYFEEIFDNYIKLGYPIREMTQILMSSLTYVESKKCIEFSDKYNLNKRIEIAKQTYSKKQLDETEETNESSKSSKRKNK